MSLVFLLIKKCFLDLVLRVVLNESAGLFLLYFIVISPKVSGIIKQAGGELLKDLELFDVYKGKGLEDNQKSLAFHLMYRSDDRTLKDEEVEEVQKKIIGKLENELGAKIRG